GFTNFGICVSSRTWVICPAGWKLRGGGGWEHFQRSLSCALLVPIEFPPCFLLSSLACSRVDRRINRTEVSNLNSPAGGADLHRAGTASGVALALQHELGGTLQL